MTDKEFRVGETVTINGKKHKYAIHREAYDQFKKIMKGELTMKPIFISVVCEGKTTCVYDLTKVSMIFRINETSYKMIIDGQEGTYCYVTKDDCDKNFNFVVDNLNKLMKDATE